MPFHVFDAPVINYDPLLLALIYFSVTVSLNLYLCESKDKQCSPESFSSSHSYNLPFPSFSSLTLENRDLY